MSCEYCGGPIKKLGVRFCRKCARKGPAAELRSKFTPPPPIPGTAWIPMSTGAFALVDADMEAEALRFSWTPSKGYAFTQVGGRGARQSLSLHQLVLPGCGQIDHKNGNRLDCRRENLRPSTQRQNLQNAARKRISKAPYKGITRVPGRGWKAQIRIEGRNTQLGCFAAPEEAARAYDAKAREVFGEFACVNFPREGERGALETVH